jgi:hypothetical protein
MQRAQDRHADENTYRRAYTIKSCAVEETGSGSNRRAARLVLSPLNTHGYKPIVITPDDKESFRVVGRFVGALR